jgi:hypothetical protein
MQREFMKVFIRNTQTGWYYQDPSKWTPDLGAASDLGQVARAVERIFEAHLEDVEILLNYDEPRYDLILPVPPSPSRGDSQRGRQVGEESRRGVGEQPMVSRKKRSLM